MFNFFRLPSYFTGCARPGYPGIYAEVSTVVDWIEQYVPPPQPPKRKKVINVLPKASNTVCPKLFGTPKMY